jgi:cell division protein FtsW
MPNLTVYEGKKGRQPSNRNTAKTIRQKAGRIDAVYLTIAIALVVIGLIVLLSASYAKAIDDGESGYFYFAKQLRWVCVGAVFAAFFTFCHDKLLQSGAVAVSLGCILALISLYIIPTASNERRWLYIGGFQFQPSEFAKLALLVVLATWFAGNQHPFAKIPAVDRNKINWIVTLWKAYPYLLCLAYFFLILFETHLSGAGLIAIISLSMILAARKIKVRWLLLILAIILIVCVLVLFSNEYMLNRVKVLLGMSTEGSSSGDDYQITQSFLAIGSGGLTGVGLGMSRQKYLYLPEPQNDFIFAIACEELGFIGAILIVALFMLFIWRGMTIALRSRDKFKALVALGITCNLGAQIVLNLLVVTGIFPVTGISLPFFSYGGTAIMIQLAEVGMMLHISRYADLEPVPKVDKREVIEVLPQ